MTKTTKLTEKGFTLVEVVVVAVLVSVLALGIFSLFQMYMSSTRETAANFKMQRQAEALIDEISRRVRNAALVMMDGETCCDIGTGNDSRGHAAVMVIRNADHSEASSFGFNQVGGNVVVQVREGGAGGWTDFMVDGSPIYVNPNSNQFEFWEGSKQVGIEMELRTPIVKGGSDFFNLSIQRGIFRCRRIEQPCNPAGGCP